MSGRWVHVSVEMMQNPLWPRAWMPFTRAGRGSTYYCREGQIRGKARLKDSKRWRRLMRDAGH